jgi:hypothetical protein
MQVKMKQKLIGINLKNSKTYIKGLLEVYRKDKKISIN